MIAATHRWAQHLSSRHPALRAVGVYGSHGRGDAGVGSDLDLLLVVDDARGPQWERLRAWPLEELHLSADALVLRPEELEQLSGRMATTLGRECRWLWRREG